MNFKNVTRSLAAMAVMSLALMFNACNEEDVIGPAPVLTAGSAVSGLAGATVKITTTINAGEGLKTLTVLKNGQAFDSKSYTGAETTDSYSKDYVIENQPVGSTITFTFQATDQRNQASTIATQAVTISAVPAKQVVDVRGLLTGNITWTKDKIYRLFGFVRLGGDTLAITPAGVSTGVLTIEPGTVIVGDRISKGTLVVQRGSRIIANGTAAAPIVFTSERPVGQREPGDWGGLVICGKAVCNQGIGVQLEGSYKGFHGGTEDDDNSGSLRYVRVEYAGVPINPNAEVNSFTFGSVGSATTTEYLQASFGLDDSFEWFGGTVNAKYLVAYRGLDDDFDMDFGYRGNVQFIVGIRSPTSADQSGSNGFEIDNDGRNTAATPFTSATISNATLIGPKATSTTAVSPQFQNGMHLRRNNRAKIYNTVVTAYPNGIFIDDNSTRANAASGALTLNRVVLAGVAGWGTDGFGQGTTDNPRGFAIRNVDTAVPAAPITVGTQTVSDWFTAQPGNSVVNSYAATGLNANLFNTGTPTFTLGNGGSLATG
ncbi:MAG: Ig-like domain repeat protein, partial [Runella slithyformis]